MVDFGELLNAMYRIEGKSDPGHPASTSEKRLAEIYKLAGEMLEQAGCSVAGWIHPDLKRERQLDQ